MSHFCGFHKLVVLFIFFFIFFTAALTRGAAQENPLLEVSSREDLVKIAGYGEEKLSTVLVTGSIHCEACLHGDGEPQLRAWPVSGALVAVKCHHHGKKSRSRWAQAAQQGVTDEFGDFVVDLPSQLHAVPNLEKTCSITVLRVPKNSPCRPAHVRKQKGLRLSSVGNSIRIYNAGRIKFLHMTSRPLKACMKRSGDKEMLW